MRSRNNSGVIQVIVVAGLTILLMGFLWIVVTLPVSAMIEKGLSANWFDADMLNTVTFLKVFIAVFVILVGLSVTAWGWVRTVEERETGFSSV